MMEKNNPNESLLVGVDGLCSILEIGRTKFYQQKESGAFGPMPVPYGGKRCLYDLQEVRDWIQIGRCCSRKEWLAMTEVKK